MKIVLESILENISTRNDGSVKLVLGSQEIKEDDAGRLFQLRNKFIKVLLSDTNISEMEEKIVDEQPLQNGKKLKKKSQQLRAVLYVLWTQHNESYAEFEDYYNYHMERIIEHLKTKIEN